MAVSTGASSGTAVAVGLGVLVGGTGVLVGGTGVLVGGTGVLVGGIGVLVGGIGVLVGGTGVLVGGIGVLVGGTGVGLGGTGVGLGVAVGSGLSHSQSWRLQLGGIYGVAVGGGGSVGVGFGGADVLVPEPEAAGARVATLLGIGVRRLRQDRRHDEWDDNDGEEDDAGGDKVEGEPLHGPTAPPSDAIPRPSNRTAATGCR